MMDFIIRIMPNVVDRFDVFVESIYETLLMILISGSIALILGLIFGTILVVTRPGDILENKAVYTVLGKIVDLFRAAPLIDHGYFYWFKRCVYTFDHRNCSILC